MKTETRALVVGAGLLIAGALVGVSGAIDGDVFLILAGSVLTVISAYITVSAFIRYQWAGLADDIINAYYSSKVATEDYLAEVERRKNE